MSASGWRATAAGCLFTVLACTLAATPAAAVTGGQIDTFQDGSTNAWETGSPSPTPPVNVAFGGPDGATDRYMLATSSGVAGPGGRLVLFNKQQWAGDYLAAGITAISMDLRNLGSTALELHLALNNAAYTTTGLLLAAGSGWTNVSFSLLPADLTGPGSATLASVSELRLYHGSATPAVLAAQLGIDNINAVSAVPEPASAALWLAGLACVAGLAGSNTRKRRRHRRPTPS